jgi:hypothetical protein
MTECYFKKRGEFQIRKPRRRKGQQNPEKPRRIVGKRKGFFYTEIEYDDGEKISIPNEE